MSSNTVAIQYDDDSIGHGIAEDCLNASIIQLVRTVEGHSGELGGILPHEVAYVAWEQAWYYSALAHPTNATYARKVLEETVTYPNASESDKKLILEYSVSTKGHRGNPILDPEKVRKMRVKNKTLKEIGEVFNVTAEAVRKNLLK